jgi:hypothetical protein
LSTAVGLANRFGVPLFVLWTLFVWGGRLRNLWLDDGGLAQAGRWSLAGAVVFTGFGLVIGALWLTERAGRGAGSILRRTVLALAGLTSVVWLVRGADIAIGDHSIGFIAVHLVLAIVSIALASVAALTVVLRSA